MIKAIAIMLFGMCPVEEADYCVWDAATQGNGEGVSFLFLGNVHIFLD